MTCFRSTFYLLIIELIFSCAVKVFTAPKGAYLHIPFCRRRCFYCDFPIQVVGDGYKGNKSETYTNLLVEEIKQSAGIFESPSPLETVYFGGGTPSLLPIPQLARVLQAIDSTIGIQSCAEVTIEIDPGTFNREKLFEWLGLGFNRFSLGIQSFDALILEKCGRAHKVQDIQQALDILNNCGQEINFSIDLISGLPYLSIETWKDTLHLAVLSGASHISIYDLQIEEKTAFGRWYKDTIGQFPLPTEDVAVDMYRLAGSILTAHGFEHYEISNYAKPGKRSRHNQLYWNRAATWGFGLSAASFTHNTRYSRPARMVEYEQWLDVLTVRGYNAAIGRRITHIEQDKQLQRGQVESDEGEMSGDLEETIDMLQDVIMLSLRTSDGLNLTELTAEYGSHWLHKIDRAVSESVEKGLVLYTTGNRGDVMRLSDPQGFLVSNDIISTIFASLDI